MDFRSCVALACVLPACALAQAQPSAFPSKPIRLIVGFSPGSNSDSLARPMAQRGWSWMAFVFFDKSDPDQHVKKSVTDVH